MATEKNNYEKACALIEKIGEDVASAIAFQSTLLTAYEEKSINQKIKKVFKDTQGEFAYYLNQSALRDCLMMCLARIHDRSGGDKASLSHVFVLIGKPGVVEMAVSKSRLSGIPKRIKEGRERFDQINSETLEKLRTFRINHLAHNLLLESNGSYGKYSDFYDLLDETVEIVSILLLALNGIDPYFADVKEIWETRATDYWGIVASG